MRRILIGRAVVLPSPPSPGLLGLWLGVRSSRRSTGNGGWWSIIKILHGAARCAGSWTQFMRLSYRGWVTIIMTEHYTLDHIACLNVIARATICSGGHWTFLSHVVYFSFLVYDLFSGGFAILGLTSVCRAVCFGVLVCAYLRMIAFLFVCAVDIHTLGPSSSDSPRCIRGRYEGPPVSSVLSCPLDCIVVSH